MLVLDIDDTLVNSHNEISKENYNSLMKLQEAGYILVLASGRPAESMVDTARYLKLDKFNSYIISYNGAAIVRMKDEKYVFTHALEESEQDKIVDYIHGKGLSALTYYQGTIIYSRENDYSHIESELVGLPDRLDPDFFNNLPGPMLKFMGVGDPAIAIACEDELGGKFGESTYTTTSKPFYLEFMHDKVSKGDTLKILAEMLEIPIEEVIAVGDGKNDLTMIEKAGLGVAVENAHPELKEAADHLTLSNDDHGVSEVVEAFFFND